MNRKYDPSGRTIAEICRSAQESFYKANGYYPTEEDAVRLTDEARREIAAEKEKNRDEGQSVRGN